MTYTPPFNALPFLSTVNAGGICACGIAVVHTHHTGCRTSDLVLSHTSEQTQQRVLRAESQNEWTTIRYN